MMGPRGLRILIILAGVMGADGVILAAASAHQPDATRLAAASSMLLFHATAVLAIVALAERGLIHLRIGIAAAFVRPWIAESLYVLVAVIWFIPDPRLEKHGAPGHA